MVNSMVFPSTNSDLCYSLRPGSHPQRDGAYHAEEPADMASSDNTSLKSPKPKGWSSLYGTMFSSIRCYTCIHMITHVLLLNPSLGIYTLYTLFFGIYPMIYIPSMQREDCKRWAPTVSRIANSSSVWNRRRVRTGPQIIKDLEQIWKTYTTTTSSWHFWYEHILYDPAQCCRTSFLQNSTHWRCTEPYKAAEFSALDARRRLQLWRDPKVPGLLWLAQIIHQHSVARCTPCLCILFHSQTQC
jgi:hypothetical protein